MSKDITRKGDYRPTTLMSMNAKLLTKQEQNIFSNIHKRNYIVTSGVYPEIVNYNLSYQQLKGKAHDHLNKCKKSI